MYNDNIKNATIKDLESKAISIVDTSIALASQGYLVNKSKRVRLEWASLLLNAFENIHILNREQQHNVERIYNKLLTI